jgi:hypothetical protein
VAVAVAGCSGGQPAPRADTPAAAVAAAPSPRTPDDCPLTGAWRPCSVVDRLEHAGLAPVPRDSVRHPFLSVPGAVYAVGRGELQLFLYPDSAARVRDFATFDTARVQPRGSAVSWRAPASLMMSNNLAAILLSDNATQVERVRLALTAGLPER